MEDLDQDNNAAGHDTTVSDWPAQRRELPEWAESVLMTAPVAFVGMTDQGDPYVTPVSFAYTGDEILFHGGSGRKSLALERHAGVCVAITADVEFHRGDNPCGDSFRYRSLLVFGEARRLTLAEEVERALRLITTKYDSAAAAFEFDPRILGRTWVHGIRIRAITCKARPAA